jgi:Uma2 family endonuclease
MSAGRRAWYSVCVSAAPSFPVASEPLEQRMLLNVSWKEYLVLRELLDSSGLRMTYSKGALELMSPSIEHELWKTNIARFVEHFAYLRNVDLRGYGSATFRKEMELHGAEPDECYLVGKAITTFPEIVLEVVYTTPLLDKRTIYAAMGVPEVWVFEKGEFTIWLRNADGRYAPAADNRSPLIPALDFALLARFVLRQDTPQALREYEKELGVSLNGP